MSETKNSNINITYYNKLKELNKNYNESHGSGKDSSSSSITQSDNDTTIQGETFKFLTKNYLDIIPSNSKMKTISYGNKSLFTIDTPYGKSLFCKVISLRHCKTTENEAAFLKILNEENGSANQISKKTYKILLSDNFSVGNEQYYVIVSNNLKEYKTIKDFMKNIRNHNHRKNALNKIMEREIGVTNYLYDDYNVIHGDENEGNFMVKMTQHFPVFKDEKDGTLKVIVDEGDENRGPDIVDFEKMGQNYIIVIKNGDMQCVNLDTMKLKAVDFGCSVKNPVNVVKNKTTANNINKKIQPTYLTRLSKTISNSKIKGDNERVLSELFNKRNRLLSQKFKNLQNTINNFIMEELETRENDISSTTNDLPNSTPSLPDCQVHGA